MCGYNMEVILNDDGIERTEGLTVSVKKKKKKKTKVCKIDCLSQNCFGKAGLDFKDKATMEVDTDKD